MQQEPIKEVSFPAATPEESTFPPATPEERALHQAAAGDPTERRRLAKVYDDAASIWDAMRDEQAILVRASWLLKRAGYEEGEVEVEYEVTDWDADKDADGNRPKVQKKAKVPGWVLRREAAPLPHRSQIEKDHPEAIMPVDECEAGHAKMREVAAGVKR